MHSKTFLSSVDAERKRLTPNKIELSIIDDANAISDKIDKGFSNLNETSKNLDKFARDASMTGQELYDELQIIKKKGSDLVKLIEKTEKELDKRLDARVELAGYIETAESILKKLDKSAKDLGMDAKQIPAYTDVQNKIEKSEDLIKDTKSMRQMADKNLSNAMDISKIINNLK